MNFPPNGPVCNFVSIVEQLEERVLFDGVPDATFILPENLVAEAPMPIDARMVQQTTQQSAVELIIVDGGVENSDELIRSILEESPDRTFEIRILDSTTDGVAQITDILSQSNTEFDAIHILSHGDEGQVNLGNTVLSSENLVDFADQIAGWANALSADADLLFYGCELAGNAEGEQFIESISAITGADVAASDDVTGHESLEGDWVLEVSVGTINVQTLEAHNWVGELQTVILASDQADVLVAADVTDPNPATNEEIIGPLNAASVEAIARDPFTGELYGANGNNLGLINQDTGEYNTIGTTFGTATSASAGFSETLGPVVALGFDPTNGDLLGVAQRAGADLLFKIDTATGTFVTDAFGVGEDFILIDTSGAGAGPATDDIAVDNTGRIFITTGAHLAEVIVTGNTSTVNLIGAFGPDITDVEGLSTDASGNLFGSTGGATLANGSPNPNANSIWQIDKTTGAATNQIQLDDGGDYEGLEAFINTVDLELEKTTSATVVNVGDIVTFTVTVTNTDPNILAPGVEVTDPVPAGLTFVSANASKGSYDNTTNIWDCLLYTSPSPRDRTRSRMPSSA